MSTEACQVLCRGRVQCDLRALGYTRDMPAPVPAHQVRLIGRLICADSAEAELVRQLLPEHVRATRREPGCEEFFVEPTGDPLVWEVRELFIDQRAFDAHQTRVQASEWGRATAAIRREYHVTLE